MNNGDKLPSNIDAEKALLSSIMMAPDRVLSENGSLRAEHFHHPSHVKIFEQMLAMREASKPVDLVSLAQWLSDRKLLEKVGGDAYLTDVFACVPTAANAYRYAEIVQEKAVERQTLLIGRQIADGSLKYEQAREALDEIEIPTSSSFRDLLLSRRFNAKNPPPPIVPIYEINRQAICTPGNITAISSHIKSGKTAWIGAAIAASFGRDGDTLGVDSNNPNNHAVIHFDCEQCSYDHHMIVRTALSRIGLEESPPWVRSYHLLGLPLADRWALLEFELKEAQKEFGGIHSVHLDGYADYVKDPNDPDESFFAVERFQGFAVQFWTHILGIIHLNPGPNMKTRGHLGSQLARKAESNIELAKDENEVTTVYTSSSRHAYISKKDGPRFKWDSEQEMHVTCAPIEKEREDAKRGAMVDLVTEIFNIPGYSGGLPWEEIHCRIEKLEKSKRGGARKRFDKLRDAKLIRRTSVGLWDK